MEQIGYSLVNAGGVEVQIFGDTAGQLPSLPEVILLPNGDVVHCPALGPLGDYTLATRWLVDERPSKWHASVGWTILWDDEKVIKTINYEDTPSIVPQIITPRQARLMLLSAGLLDQVNAGIAQAGGSAQITWDYATEISRSDPLINTIGSALALSAAQIDDMFRQASTI